MKGSLLTPEMLSLLYFSKEQINARLLKEGEENLRPLLDKLNSEFILHSSNSLSFFFSSSSAMFKVYYICFRFLKAFARLVSGDIF